MDGFTVPVEPVETASSAAARLAEATGQVDLRGALQMLAEAMPGSETARVIGGIGQDWPASLDALTGVMRGNAEAMAATARAYRDIDSTIMARLGRL